MTGGYVGKILVVNLTTGGTSTVNTANYEDYGGGLGIATALFWDMAVASGDWDMLDAFDSRNVITFMSSPLTGTGIPYCARCSVTGVSPQAWPINWFSRSNFGGTFATMMKYAGYDGIAVTGKAEAPVWINVIDDTVTVEDASALWGLTTWEAQQEIWRIVGGRTRYGSQWMAAGDSYTTQRPSVVCCGPAGETLSRVASLVHGAGSGAGQGGFGGVFGSKNLKAISVVGTGSISVADPDAVIKARQWFNEEWPKAGLGGQGKPSGPFQVNGVAGCMGCDRQCRPRSAKYGTECNCMDTYWYNPPAPRVSADVRDQGSNLLQQYGINAFDTAFGGAFAMPVEGNVWLSRVPDATGLGWYIKWLYDEGHIGPGTAVDTAPLPMENYGTAEFAAAFVKAICTREGFGALIADGTIRFAENIGRLSDTDSILRYPQWGCVFHWTLPDITWAYGGLVGARDTNHHDFELGNAGPWTMEEMVNLTAEKTIPYTGDPFMFDYSWQGEQAYLTGIYSTHKAKQIAWHRHYGSFWKESALYCDEVISSWVNALRDDWKGPTPDAEPVMYNAVTGLNLSFADGMEIGRRIWNLKRAIRVLQGRHRNQERFGGFMYRPGASFFTFGALPIFDGSEWTSDRCGAMYLTEAGVETWKSHFYNLEGWNNYTGWPTRATLEGLSLKNVADHLESMGKLGEA